MEDQNSKPEITEAKTPEIAFNIDSLSDEQKTQLAEKLKVKYFEENKSLKDFKAKIQAEKEQAEKLALEEQGKFKELADIHESKLKDYKRKLAVNSLKEILTEKGISKGALNLAISAYSDKLEINENDEVSNLEGIVNELETSSPEIFSKKQTGFNPPANPQNVLNNKPMAFSEWQNLGSKEKIQVRDKQGVDYSK